ncbi:MAG: carbamoyltransferase HypF [Syntrophales bacterium]|nr:carbamoyltransferase HypF [Syntrophales bacterium]
MHDRKKRKRFFFSGIVQGVGFRPYLYRIAQRYELGGFVRNTPEGVLLEVEGPDGKLAEFFQTIMEELPPAAEVTHVEVSEEMIKGESSFHILESDQEGKKEVIIPPDIAVCEDCLKELNDPRDRRYLYPFINCTNCGPRLTIIRDVPYDRPNTSMSCFAFCAACRAEYVNPSNRRFHAEPNACPVCGPRLWLTASDGKRLTEYDADPIREAANKLKQGMCVAIKGLGGFHLAVDATSEEAVIRLRQRKCREEKPFALMVQNLEAASELVEIGQEEKRILLSPRRPIVLCKKKEGARIASAVAPGMRDLGIMLPYTPVHHLLLAYVGLPLVMTSGNMVDEPICIGNREAILRLKNIADYFLLHNRDILVRCDDSVEMAAGNNGMIIRRSRGWAPRPIMLNQSFPDVLALGGHLKSSLCVLTETKAYLSPHIGDLETPEARDFFLESIKIMERISGCNPDIIACDLHPAYWTSQLAEKLSRSHMLRVQHHHAHVVSAMAENGLTGCVLGIALDGTGYGDDGTVWGGEFLLADFTGYERVGHIAPYPLPGAEAAVKEPWRSAIGILFESFGEDWEHVVRKLSLVDTSLQLDIVGNMMRTGFNTPRTSSLGRLFDAVSAIVGVRRKVSFEGQAAMELQALVRGDSSKCYPFSVTEQGEKQILDLRPLIRALVDDVIKKIEPSVIISAFHFTIIEAVAAMTKALINKTRTRDVVLSGGCFQNKVLFEGLEARLRKNGVNVYTNREVPVNDGGLSLGQAVVAGALVKKAGW